MFRRPAKTFPVLKPSMLEPIDTAISTAMAKKLYRQIMLKIGYLDQQEVGSHVEFLVDEIKEEEQSLKAFHAEAVANAAADIAENTRRMQ
jgi:hypothetical protein